MEPLTTQSLPTIYKVHVKSDIYNFHLNDEHSFNTSHSTMTKHSLPWMLISLTTSIPQLQSTIKMQSHMVYFNSTIQIHNLQYQHFPPSNKSFCVLLHSDTYIFNHFNQVTICNSLIKNAHQAPWDNCQMSNAIDKTLALAKYIVSQDNIKTLSVINSLLLLIYLLSAHPLNYN